MLVERGDYLPREPRDWDSRAVIVDGVYRAKETWHSSNGKSVHPGLHDGVGGNSKFYGTILLRLRERDFGEIRYEDGIFPARPIGYDAFEPYDQAAEELFHVHGRWHAPIWRP